MHGKRVDGIVMKQSSTNIYTSFHLDKTEMAIDVKAVQEVVNFPERIIPMPLAPDFLLGIFNLRGMIIPIINLKALLKYPDTEVNSSQKVAIVEIESAKVGLVFDSTSEILRVHEEHVSDFGYVSEKSHKVIRGGIKLDNGERILQIIDTEALITIENIPQILQQQKITQKEKEEIRIDQRHKCISFCVQDIKMAIEISKIHEIVKVPEIKPSSIQSDIFLGIINLRGRTIPVVSFAKILKVKVNENDTGDIEDQRIIILKMDKELIGMAVDSVECINSYYEKEVMAVPVLNKNRTTMFQGCISFQDIGEVFLLSHEHILSNHEVMEVTEGHSKMYQNEALQNTLKIRNRESYISFRLDHLFGISIKDIKEIINYSDDILNAPGMPHYVKGMLNLRSNLVTIIDTRMLYKMPLNHEVNSETKVLIFEKNNERFGLVVDALESILAIDEDKKFKVPSLLTQKIQTQFQDDIKEIVSVPIGEKEGALIILNVDSITERIKLSKAA
nr:chemotaxis protein CheW [Bacteriovorax sp. HI3]